MPVTRNNPQREQRTGVALVAVPRAAAFRHALAREAARRCATHAEAARIATLVALASVAIAFQYSLAWRISVALGLTMGIAAFSVSRRSLWAVALILALAWLLSRLLYAWAISIV